MQLSLNAWVAFLFLQGLLSSELSPRWTHATDEFQQERKKADVRFGGVVRTDRSQKRINLVFTGHEFADGGELIRTVLKKHGIPASFFFTGDFYRNKNFSELISALRSDGHYLGAHSDKHLLYCSWERRDSLLVTQEQFQDDLMANYLEALLHFEWVNFGQKVRSE